MDTDKQEPEGSQLCDGPSFLRRMRRRFPNRHPVRASPICPIRPVGAECRRGVSPRVNPRSFAPFAGRDGPPTCCRSPPTCPAPRPAPAQSRQQMNADRKWPRMDTDGQGRTRPAGRRSAAPQLPSGRSSELPCAFPADSPTSHPAAGPGLCIHQLWAKNSASCLWRLRILFFR